MAEETPTTPTTPSPATLNTPWPMRLLGIRRVGKPKWFPFRFTIWGKICGALIVIVCGSLAFAEYSMQPDFCRSCHIMEPYYRAWHESSHKGVPCTDCHFEPGLENTLYGKWQASSQAVKYVTKTYGSKPHAEIYDTSCMRSGCHERRLLEGQVEWEVPSVRGGHVTIKFDHKPHLTEERRGKHLRCVSCHSQIVQGQHIVVTLDTCFLCHFKGFEHGRNEETLGGCKACHGVPKGEIRLATGNFNHASYVDRGVQCQSCHSDIVKGDGSVPKQSCWTCHNQLEQISKYGETKMLHEQHVSEHKVECSSCHIKIEHNLSTASASATPRDASHMGLGSGTCASCHTATHGGPAEMYRGVGGRGGVPEMPSPMSRARVDCIACHKQTQNSSADAQFVGQTYLAIQQSCDNCHGNKYADTLDQWKNAINAHVARAEESLAATQKLLAKNGGTLDSALKLQVQRLIDDADYNIRFVKLAHGVHNVNYATALLNVAIENCNQASKILGEPAKGAPSQ